MKLIPPIVLRDLLGLIDFTGSVIGEKDILVRGINDDAVAEESELTWVPRKSLQHKILRSNVGCVITDILPDNNKSIEKTIILARYPLQLFDQLIHAYFNKASLPRQYVTSPIVEGAYIGKNVSIGKNCIINPGAVLHDNVIIGNNVIIQSNSVIGSSPFSYQRDLTGILHSRMVWGNTVIEDDVEIGAGCTIDKGLTSDTVIGKGTKIDNQVHIGHDVFVGKNCSFSAQVGIAGYVHINDGCSFWGKSSVSNRIEIASNTNVLGGAIVTKDIKKEGLTICGFPAQKSSDYWKKEATISIIAKNYYKNEHDNC